MASIPLAALAVRPPEQVDTLGQYGKALALKSMIQNQQFEQQHRPLQLQAEQQSIQQQQLATQQQQQAIADQHATTQSMLNWNGQDPTELQKMVLSNGGSGNAALALSKHFLDIRNETATAVKNEGEGALAKANAQKALYEQVAGQINSFANLPDDQLPQALLSAAQHLDPQHAQGLQAAAQLPPGQLRKTLPAIANGFLGYSAQVEAGLKQADAAAKNAQLPGMQAESAKKLAEQNEMQASGLTPSQFEAKAAGAKAGAEAKAKFPYESNLVAVRQQVENQFWNNKDVASQVENKYLLPYQQKMASVNELNSAVDQAQSGNVAAARGVLLKLIGVSNPDGTKRYNSAEAHQLSTMGGVPQRFQGTVQNLLTGDQWTPEMAKDIKSFADAQGQVAGNTLKSGIDSVNILHNTKIGQGLKDSLPASIADQGTPIYDPSGKLAGYSHDGGKTYTPAK